MTSCRLLSVGSFICTFNYAGTRRSLALAPATASGPLNLGQRREYGISPLHGTTKPLGGYVVYESDKKIYAHATGETTSGDFDGRSRK